MTVSTPGGELTYTRISDWTISIHLQIGDGTEYMGDFNQNADGVWSLWLVDAGLGWTMDYRKRLDAALEQLQNGQFGG